MKDFERLLGLRSSYEVCGAPVHIPCLHRHLLAGRLGGACGWVQLLIVADTVVDLTTLHFRRVTVCVVAHKVCSAARTSARYSELERRPRALEDQNLDKITLE